jgi:hypothetical protein
MKSLAKLRSRPLSFRDSIHLKSAQCWLCVGDFNHADGEFKRIRRSSWTHPQVVKLRYTFMRMLHGW